MIWNSTRLNFHEILFEREKKAASVAVFPLSAPYDGGGRTRTRMRGGLDQGKVPGPIVVPSKHRQ
jgi:hypothetical protein